MFKMFIACIRSTSRYIYSMHTQYKITLAHYISVTAATTARNYAKRPGARRSSYKMKHVIEMVGERS